MVWAYLDAPSSVREGSIEELPAAAMSLAAGAAELPGFAGALSPNVARGECAPPQALRGNLAYALNEHISPGRDHAGAGARLEVHHHHSSLRHGRGVAGRVDAADCGVTRQGRGPS